MQQGCGMRSIAPEESPMLVRMTTPSEFEYVLEGQSDGSFLIYVPELPGLVTEGATRDEALAMLRDALPGYLASMREHGHPLPQVERGTVAAA